MRIDAVLILLFVLPAFSGCYLITGTPEAAFHEFQTTKHKESFIVAPLCAAGESVVPLLIEKVKDRKLERRLYALGFLGTTESQVAADVLEVIVGDESESEGVRRTALQSLFMIDEAKGRRVANQYKDRADHIGEISLEILAVTDHSLYERLNSACNMTD